MNKLDRIRESTGFRSGIPAFRRSLEIFISPAGDALEGFVDILD
jgi:hypothetical protein